MNTTVKDSELNFFPDPNLISTTLSLITIYAELLLSSVKLAKVVHSLFLPIDEHEKLPQTIGPSNETEDSSNKPGSSDKPGKKKV